MGRVCAAAMGLVVLCGCLPTWMDPGYMRADGRRGSVRTVAEHFADDLRWGRVEQAGGSVHPDSRAEFLAVARSLEDQVRFTGLEVESVELGTLRVEATVTVAFTLYRLPSIEETRLVDRQSWRYDLPRRRWYIEPNLDLYRGTPPAEEDGVTSARSPR